MNIIVYWKTEDQEGKTEMIELHPEKAYVDPDGDLILEVVDV